MKIERKCYVVTRRNRRQIYCVSGQYGRFMNIDSGNLNVKTYTSRARAENGLGFMDAKAHKEHPEVLEVTETYEYTE